MFFPRKVVGRGELGTSTSENKLGKFFLLNPDFFFWRQRASTKGSARDFFRGVVFMTFFSTFFYDNPRGVKSGNAQNRASFS
jgi:hypothetical protein